MLSRLWVASTKPEAALGRSQGWTPWQGRGWTLAPCARGPEADMYCWMGHWLSPSDEFMTQTFEPAAHARVDAHRAGLPEASLAMPTIEAVPASPARPFGFLKRHALISL